MHFSQSRPVRTHFQSDIQFQDAMKDYESSELDSRYRADKNDEYMRASHEESLNKKKMDYEAKNRYFIALATLSAASITLLIQHLFEALGLYTRVEINTFKFVLTFFASSLILSMIHNFVNAPYGFGDNKLKKNVMVGLSISSVLFYVMGVSILVANVIISL